MGSSAQPTEIPVKPVRVRVEAVDLLRGLLMILMALDHTRDYFGNLEFDATNPLHSWPAMFLTRWVTHLCAPGFVALTGASVYLQRQRGKPANEVTRLLATRGIWFLILDSTLISFAWSFTLKYPFMNIISTIGLCMIGLASLHRLPVRIVGVIGAAIVLLHNLLDPVQASDLHGFSNVWILLHERGFLTYNGHPFAMVYFPALAWFGIMCLGYAFGTVLSLPHRTRLRIALSLSAVFLLAFSALRVLHGYGDSYRFDYLATPAQTAMSFFRVQKYPPSLQYTLATLGVLLSLYAIFELAVEHNWLPRLRAFVEVYGRVPFLFYVLHIFVIHTAGLLTAMAAGVDWHFWVGPGFTWGGEPPENWGYSLAVVYPVWIAVILALYLPCRWFSQVKARRRDWWLSYL